MHLRFFFKPWLLISVVLLAVCGAGCLNPKAIPVSGASTIAVSAGATGLASEIDALLNDFVRERKLNGSVLVARGNEIILSKGYGMADYEKNIPNTPQTRFRIGSLTKQFTAMAIMLLATQGKLDVQDCICKFIPDCPAAWRGITIHQLLIHASGIPNFTGFGDYNEFSVKPMTPRQMIARLSNRSLLFTPGARYNYSNSNYFLLGYIIENADGRSYEKFLEEQIFNPLGMRDTGYEHPGDSLAVGYTAPFLKADYIDMSVPYAAGALVSTVEDLYIWNRALSNNSLVPPEIKAKIFTPYNYAGLAYYGYGWRIQEVWGRLWIWHTGFIRGFEAVNSRSPNDLYIIILMNEDNLNVMSVHDKIWLKLIQ